MTFMCVFIWGFLQRLFRLKDSRYSGFYSLLYKLQVHSKVVHNFEAYLFFKDIYS